MTAETLLLTLLLLVGPRGDESRLTGDKLKDKEQMLAQLYELQRRVRAGELPTAEEMSPGRVTREQVLAGLDVRKAKHLGVDPKSIRDLLVPGFSQELDQLLRRHQARDPSTADDPSPLLTLVLDVEQRLYTAADRRRQRAGLKNPIDSGPLSQRLEAPLPAPVAPADAGAGAEPTAVKTAAPVAVDVVVRGTDPKAIGKALYRAGRYVDALKAWDRTKFDDPLTARELEYMHADALFRSGRQEDALKEWERLAADHPDTSYGQQAAFARDMARAVMAIKSARGDETPAETETASKDGAKPGPKTEKPAPKSGAGDAKDGAPKSGGGHGP